MLGPYIPKTENAVNVIRHDDKRVEADAGKMVRDFVPGTNDGLTYVAASDRPIDELPE